MTANCVTLDTISYSQIAPLTVQSHLGFIKNCGHSRKLAKELEKHTMIEVNIDSIRVSLMSQHRVVVLKDINSDRYLTIWIGPAEADAITIELQDMPPKRPLTHDLLKSVIGELGGRVVHVVISELREDVYYARIVIEIDGKQIEVDSRSSDAIALAVRVKTPIFVADSVMRRAGFKPDEDIEQEVITGSDEPAKEGDENVNEEKLSAFADFVNSLDIDLDEDEDNN